MPKTYPAYTGSYNEFSRVIDYVNQIGNLYLIGRNGMHKYNNSDHSMLTAMTAVDNILSGISSKDNLWQINTEEEYHEAKS
jgi:UDP-galactopyranose mutase